MKKTVRPAVMIFAVAGLAFSLGYVAFPHDEAEHAPARAGLVLDPGASAAPFEVTDLEGNAVSSEDFAGKILVVDFWATWCTPCITEIPHYNELYHDYVDQGVEMIGITLQSGSIQQVKDWLARPVVLGGEEHSIEYPLVMGNDAVEATWGPIYGFPMTYLVDADFKIRKKWLGAIPSKSDQLRVLIDELIEERAAAASDD